MKKRNGLDKKILRTKGKGIIEDATEYGEFVPSFDAWLTLDDQRKIVEYLENLAKEKGD